MKKRTKRWTMDEGKDLCVVKEVSGGFLRDREAFWGQRRENQEASDGAKPTGFSADSVSRMLPTMTKRRRCPDIKMMTKAEEKEEEGRLEMDLEKRRRGIMDEKDVQLEALVIYNLSRGESIISSPRLGDEQRTNPGGRDFIAGPRPFHLQPHLRLHAREMILGLVTG